MSVNDKVFGFENADDSPGFLLWQVTSLWQREIRKALEPFGLTHSQFVLLASCSWLAQQQEPVTQSHLAAHSKMDPMTTSTVLRTLEGKGLLHRLELASDTRAKSVALTLEGRRLVRQTVKIVEKFDQAFFSPLGNKLGSLNKALATLLERQDR